MWWLVVHKCTPRISPTPHPFCWLDFQLSSTVFLKEVSDNQQSIILKGLGPQSAFLEHSNIGQWSEKFFSSVYWADPGHLDIQSGDIKILSNLLLAVPFGLTHVNLLPTHGASSTSISSIHSLNSLDPPSSVPLWHAPVLSVGFLMVLKSPNIHHSPSWLCDFNFLTDSHSTLLLWI